MKTKTWEWMEATDAEFERRRHKETYYRIFYLKGKRIRPKKVTVYKFWAKGRNEAYDVLKAYRRAHPGRDYFYSSSGYFSDSKGNRYDDPGEMLHRDSDLKRNAKLQERRRRYRAERDMVFGGLNAYLKSLKVQDRHLRFAVDDFKYLVCNYDLISSVTHQVSESWRICEFVVGIFAFNLPVMIRNRTGVPNLYCERARRRLKERKNANGKISKAAMKLAVALWTAELKKLDLYVKLYRFYKDHGLIDKKCPEEVEIERKYARTIPYIPGTLQQIDYAKIKKLEDRYWRLWTSQFQRIGRDLWD